MLHHHHSNLEGEVLYMVKNMSFLESVLYVYIVLAAEDKS